MNTNEICELARRAPLFSGLADCEGSDHWVALGQTFVLLLFSMAPIWLSSLIVYGNGKDLAGAAFKAAIYGSVARGELFMYCTALLAPIFWIALVDLPGARAFPSNISHMVLTAVTGLLAAAFFGLISAGRPPNEVFTFRASLFLFGFSVVLLYLGTVYHVSRIGKATAEFKRQETDFTKAVGEHRQ
jgi:hypothetical protein